MSKIKDSFFFSIRKAIFLLIIFLLSSTTIQQQQTNGKTTLTDQKFTASTELTYTIKDNLMHTYRLLLQEETPYYVTFSIDPDTFTNNTKTIFIYSDESSYSTEICTHIAFKGSKNDEKNQGSLINYPMSVFVFNSEEKSNTKVTLKYTPKMKSGKVNIRVQTTDEEVVLFSDGRKDRIYQMFHPEHQIQSNYIVSISNSTEEAALYIEQFSGKFLLNFLSTPTDSHLLPMSLDKPFTPLKGHFSQLSTPYEIIHIIGGDPGYAQFNWITMKNSGFQMIESSRVLLFIKQDVEFSCYLPERTKSDQVINYDFKNLFDVDVDIVVKTRSTKSYKLSEKNKYLSGYTEKLDLSTKYSVTFNAKKNTIIAFTAVNGDDYYKVINDDALAITNKRILFKLDKAKISSMLLIAIKFNKYVNMAFVEGITSNAKLVPNPKRSCNVFTEVYNDDGIYFLNPYDSYNVTENEFVYYAIEILDQDVGTLDIKLNFTRKTYPDNLKKPLLKSDIIYLDGKLFNRVLLPKSLPRPHAYSIVVYSCNYYKISSDEQNNKMDIDYFPSILYDSELNDEYKVFTFPYIEEDSIIRLEDYIDLDYSGFLLSYYIYSPTNFIYENIPRADVLTTKINNLRSIKYLFDQKNGILTWTPLSSDNDETQLKIYSRNYYLCPVENSEEASNYFNNMCYIESLNISCIISSINEISVFNLVENTKYSFFEEVELPIKVRYYIGTYKYNQIEDSDYGRQFGKYKELIVQGNPTVENGSKNYYFYEYNNYETNNEGVIYLKTKSATIASELKKSALKVTECVYDKISINEKTIDDILQGTIGQTYTPLIAQSDNFVEIIFNKKVQKENFIVIEIDNRYKNYEIEIITHGKVEEYIISDNLMQSHNIQLKKKGVPTYIKFKVNETNFLGPKKGIYIYSDAQSKGLSEQQIWQNDVKNGFDDGLLLYLNLELTVFQFRQFIDETGKYTDKTGDTVTIKYIPLVDNTNVNVRVQTTDQGSVFYTGKRQNRVYQVAFTFGYADPFYIAASYSDIQEGILYISQEIGLFDVEFINEPSDTHILPLITDKHFKPLEGHFSKLNTHFEIYKMTMIDPGFAKYYTILETDTEAYIEELNSVTYIHTKPSENKIIHFPLSEKPLNIKISIIMAEKQVNGILGEQNFYLTKIDKTKYFASDFSTQLKLLSAQDAIVSISLVESDFFPKKIDKTTGHLTERRLIIEYPRGDYSSMTVSLSSDDSEFSFYESSGIERIDKFGFIPDPQKTNTYSTLESEDQRYFDLITPYPYDFYDADLTEMFYESIVITSQVVRQYTVTMTPKKKSSYGKVIIESGEFVWVTNPSSEVKYGSQKIYLGAPEDSLFKPKKFLMMAHSCAFKAKDEYNVISLNYDETKLYEKNITSEYQFFNLTYTYHHMNMEIFFNNVFDGKNDIILSYYLYDKDTPNYNVMTKDQLIKESEYYKSEKYLIEIVGEYLKWTLINDRQISGRTNLNKKYLICALKSNTINECAIQAQIIDGSSACSYTTANEFKLERNMTDKYMIIYQEVEFPIKVRYLIGHMKYSSKQEQESSEMVGSYAKMYSNRTYSLAQSENGLFFFDFQSFKSGTEGIIAIKTDDKDIILNAKSYKYDGLSLNEDVLNRAINDGVDMQKYEDLNENLIELIFKKPENAGENNYYVLVLELDKSIRSKDAIIMPRGEIETSYIQDDLMLNKVFEFSQIGVPLYYTFKINNFNTNKKGILVYTDNDLSSGNHVVMPCLYSQRNNKDNLNEEYKNYPLSAFLYRKYDNGTQTGDCVTIRLIPKLTQKSITVKVQTTNEGLIIFNGERQSRVYEVIFSNSYNAPFYIVSTTPYVSKSEYVEGYKEFGYLYIEQIVGQFEIKIVKKAVETHILPSNDDNTFVPLVNHFSYLLGKFEIMHIRQINPGRAKFYFFADDGSDKLTVNPDSEELIYVPSDNEFVLSFNKQSENLNLRFKYVASVDAAPISLSYDGEQKSLSSDNAIISVDEYIGHDIHIKSNTDSFMILTTATKTFSNKYTIVKNNQSNLKNQYLLIAYPKTSEYAKININIESMNGDKIETYSLMTKEEGTKYVVDPTKSINKNYYGYYGDNLLGKNMSNPYDQYNVSKDEYYYLNVKVLNENIPEYKVTINIYKPSLPKTATRLKNNTLTYVYKYSTSPDKNFNISSPYNLEFIIPKPKAVSVFVHQCNYKPHKNNSISLNYYSDDSLWSRPLRREYQVFNILNDYQNMNFVIKKDIKEKANDQYNDFLLSYYLYDEQEYENIRQDRMITQKIDYLLGESYIINVNGNKLNWMMTSTIKLGGTVPIRSRKFIICQIKEDKEAQKYFSNNCYLEKILKDENNKCKYTNNNEYDVSNIENNRLVLIAQEVELPVKVRLFVGTYKNNKAQFDSPYYVAIGIIFVIILFASAALVYACLVSKRKLSFEDLQDLGINDDKEEKIK